MPSASLTLHLLITVALHADDRLKLEPQDAKLHVPSTLEVLSCLFLLTLSADNLTHKKRLILEMNDEMIKLSVRIMLIACHSVSYYMQICWHSWKHVLKNVF